jgi:hypothetical protein
LNDQLVLGAEAKGTISIFHIRAKPDRADRDIVAETYNQGTCVWQIEKISTKTQQHGMH